jgi:nucleoside-diphosphate-sugar epimerase
MDSLQNKRLVIFGCGYVGSALARAAMKAGAQVTALTRNPEKAAALGADGVRDVVVGELSSTDWHGRIAPGADFVVNCVSSGGGGLDGYRRSYVGGMKSILHWAATGAQPVGTFVYTSSTSVYPQGNGAVVDESATPLVNVAGGGALVEAENLLRSAAAEVRRRWFILRLAGIYGPGRHLLLDQLRAGADMLPGTGNNRLNLVHRDDVVATIQSCLAAPTGVANEVFNVSDGQPATKREIVEWLAQQLGRAVPMFDGIQPPSARRGGEPVPDRIISNARLRARLNWRPRFPSFREGYRALLDLPEGFLSAQSQRE